MLANDICGVNELLIVFGLKLFIDMRPGKFGGGTLLG
jgi:hypothetical protein